MSTYPLQGSSTWGGERRPGDRVWQVGYRLWHEDRWYDVLGDEMLPATTPEVGISTEFGRDAREACSRFLSRRRRSVQAWEAGDLVKLYHLLNLARLQFTGVVEVQ